MLLKPSCAITMLALPFACRSLHTATRIMMVHCINTVHAVANGAVAGTPEALS